MWIKLYIQYLLLKMIIFTFSHKLLGVLNTIERTLLKLGKSSLVVVLPKDWLHEMGLKNGDKVMVKQEEDGALKIVPQNIFSTKPEKERSIVINADKCKSKGLLERLLVANYLLGNDSIIICSKKESIEPQKLREIRKISQKLRGFEVIEQRTNRIYLQCLADSKKFSLENLISRMLALLLSMIDYVRKGISGGSPEYLEEVIYMEEEMDRLHWFAVRQILLMQRNRALAKALGVKSPLHLIGNRLILKLLELAGDYVEEMAKDAKNLELEKVLALGDILENFELLIDKVEDVISDSVRAFNGLDIILSNDIISRIDILEAEARRLSEEIVSRGTDVPTSVKLIRILTRVIDMCRSISVVGEVVINRSTENLGADGFMKYE